MCIRDSVYSKHKYTNTTDATDVDVLTAGMDSDCGTFLGQNLQACIDDGTCDASIVNPPLTNLFKVQLRLGMFDSAASQPYTKLGMESVSTPAHQALALEAAQQGIVLSRTTAPRCRCRRRRRRRSPSSAPPPTRPT